jgi:hypothetical protein
MVSPGISRRSVTLAIKVAMGHVAALALMFAMLQTGSCRTEKTQLTKVRLVSLPQPQDSPVGATDLREKLDSSPKRMTREVVYRTPEQIRQRGFIKTKKRSKSVAKSVFIRKKYTFTELKNRLVQVSNSAIGSNVDISISETENNYVELITRHIYRLWDQPGRTEIHGDQRPIVKIRLRIEKSGIITIKRIITESKSSAMNNSVVRLIKDLKRFPPFPAEIDKRSIDKSVILELT